MSSLITKEILFYIYLLTDLLKDNFSENIETRFITSFEEKFFLHYTQSSKKYIKNYFKAFNFVSLA